MKIKKYLLSTAILFCLATFTEDVFMQGNFFKKDSFAKMTFEVELNKSEYYPLEPLVAKFKFSNQTEKSLVMLSPYFEGETEMHVNFNGKNISGSIANSQVRLVRLNNTFQPGQSIQEDLIIVSQLGHFFPKPGNYQIQFILSGGKEGRIKLKSDLIDVNIKTPTGTDKEALEFIKKYQDKIGTAPTAFGWGDQQDENGQTLLETFVSRFSGSIYGEYATLGLGIYYLYSTGELLEAKLEFEKLKFGNNSLLVGHAKKFLFDIEKKQADLQKQIQP